jgi:hypothetical protein
MLSIAIDLVKTRYRMPAAALREQARVQRIVDDALARVLEGAIERKGVGPDGYVCIRDVHAVATLRLREPDAALATGVGDAIAGAIQRLIDEGSPSVVQYRSRAHALVDLAASATAGEFSRSWAWAQVGIWRTDFPLRVDLTAELVVRTLAKEPAHAVAVIAYLAREHVDRFDHLITRATPNAWDALAQAAVRAAGGVVLRPARVAGTAGDVLADVHPDPDWRQRRLSIAESIARRVAAQSAIARISIERFASVPEDIRSALATLALLELEPSAVRAGNVEPLLLMIERAMRLAVTDTVGRVDARYRETPAAAAQKETSRNEAPRPEEAAPVVDTAEPGPIDVRDPRQAAHDAGRDASSVGDLRAADTVPDVRVVTRTGHGGVLYLVNLLPRVGLIETLSGDEQWSRRGLRWVLHHLSVALAAMEPDDPGALVFAGLAPGARPPSSLQDPPTDVERAALDTLSDTITRALRETLGDLSGLDARTDRQLLDAVCRRPAQIAAEPGWIEARFSPEDVSLDIRRAGLDRDPEWVPWLGIVLRFVYA